MRAAAVALAAAFLAAAGAQTAGAATGPSFAVGYQGGLVRPLKATISPTGAVAVNGRVRKHVRASTLASLAALAKRERFFSLPRQIRCGNVLPDVATQYVTVRVGGRSRTVYSLGGCNKRFARVFRAVAVAAGIT